jgi:hypothetical protein
MAPPWRQQSRAHAPEHMRARLLPQHHQYNNRSERASWQGTEEWLDRGRFLPDISASSR